MGKCVINLPILGMSSVHDSTAISLDGLSVRIIRYLRPIWLVQNNLKSETKTEYTKLRKATDNNNWKSGS